MMIEIFFLVGIILLLGYVADILFGKTGISYVLILMAFGFLIGPTLGIISFGEAGFPPETTAMIGTLALIVILFDSGLNLNIFKLLKVFTSTIFFTILAFIISSIAVTFIMTQLFGWELMEGLLLGFVVGGNSSVVVTTMMAKAKSKPGTDAAMILESSITDVLCIVSTYALLKIIQGGGQLIQTPTILTAAFSTAIVIGVASGIIWLIILKKLQEKKHNYMITLAAAFLVFSFSETLGGNGGIAVLFYALSIGNVQNISHRLHLTSEYNPSTNIKLFQEEISFFVRSFFFVFLGVILIPEQFMGIALIAGLILSAVFILIRFAMTKFIPGIAHIDDTKVVISMIPRGLAAAVLATLPATQGIIIGSFEGIVFGVIIISNIVATAGLYISRKNKDDEEIEVKKSKRKTKKSLRKR